MLKLATCVTARPNQVTPQLCSCQLYGQARRGDSLHWTNSTPIFSHSRRLESQIRVWYLTFIPIVMVVRNSPALNPAHFQPAWVDQPAKYNGAPLRCKIKPLSGFDLWRALASVYGRSTKLSNYETLADRQTWVFIQLGNWKGGRTWRNGWVSITRSLV